MHHRSIRQRRPGRRIARRLASTALAVVLAGLAAGCQGYNWQSDFVAAEREAGEQNRDLFIFYKWWLDEPSNRMLGRDVLSHPTVEALFRDTVNVLIDKDYGPEYTGYVGKFGVTDVPAAIIVRPDGTVHVRRGFITRDRFIAFVNEARSPRAGEATQPAPTRDRRR